MPNKGNALFVTFGFTNVKVKSKDVLFIIYQGKGRSQAKFGELRVSQGAVVWRGRSDKLGRKMSWTRFDKLMQGHGRHAERRKASDRKSVPAAKRKSRGA